MIHITPDKFNTVPWKNGKGLTQHIVSSHETGDYDWRFSRADVSVDGPFSIFEGKSRILTVIEGDGISLISSESSIQAAAFIPVSFSGEVPVRGKLWNGPIKDLNLIYATERIQAQAVLINGPDELKLKADGSHMYGIYCVAGHLCDESSQTLNPGDFAIIKDSANTLSVGENTRALLYTLDLIN